MQPTQYFRALNREPPNGGVPPAISFYSINQPQAPTTMPVGPFPNFPSYMHQHLDPRMFLPPQQEIPAPDCVRVHIIKDKINFEAPNGPLRFYYRDFAGGLTVADVMRDLGVTGVMEVHELGSRWWARGQAILPDSVYAKKTLRELGWVKRRGTEVVPIWVIVRKAT
ncbi:MAG: hypothetical protein Q9166_006252 [cf. Caloplaca sp. 2 TL-2023]